uniref:Uncharacterized protein n=1 Tax=Cacopsylla melanoneura TaxID=428564 RepID=A0A8D9FFE3_9HEMI
MYTNYIVIPKDRHTYYLIVNVSELNFWPWYTSQTALVMDSIPTYYVHVCMLLCNKSHNCHPILIKFGIHVQDIKEICCIIFGGPGPPGGARGPPIRVFFLNFFFFFFFFF